MRRGLACVLGVLGLACAESTELTQVVVLVGGDPAIRVLDVRVLDEATGRASSVRTIDLAQRAVKRLPTSFTVAPPKSGAADRFRLSIEGISRSENGDRVPLARTEVVATFTRGESTLLPIVLSAACASEHCDCDGSSACDRVCRVEANEPARCVATPVYERLPTLTPGQELDVLTRGLGACDRGSLPGPTGACEDVDECAFGVDSCSVSPPACVNRLPDAGRFHCACPAGFEGDGVTDDPCVFVCDGGACAAEAGLP